MVSPAERVPCASEKLYLNFRYLDVAPSGLGFEADRSARGVGTDGFVMYYRPAEYWNLVCDTAGKCLRLRETVIEEPKSEIITRLDNLGR